MDDPKGELIEGLEVRASFGVKGGEMLLVPRDAILPELDSNVIFVLDNERAKKIKIAIKGYQGLNAYIEPLGESLKSTARVIVVGAERLRDGESVVEVKE